MGSGLARDYSHKRFGRLQKCWICPWRIVSSKCKMQVNVVRRYQELNIMKKAPTTWRYAVNLSLFCTSPSFIKTGSLGLSFEPKSRLLEPEKTGLSFSSMARGRVRTLSTGAFSSNDFSDAIPEKPLIDFKRNKLIYTKEAVLQSP